MNNNQEYILAPGLENNFKVQWYSIGLPIWLFGPKTLGSGMLLVKETKYRRALNLKSCFIDDSDGLSIKLRPSQPDTDSITINLATESLNTLSFLMKSNLINEQTRALINQAYVERKYGNHVTSVSLTINVPNRFTIVQRKIEAKGGVTFGNLFQKYMLLPSDSITINTIERQTYTTESNSNANNNLRSDLFYDVDYKIKIYDLKTFVGKFNQYYYEPGNYGTDAFRWLLNAYFSELEPQINSFAQSHTYDEVIAALKNQAGGFSDALNVFNASLEALKKEFGIEVVQMNFNCGKRSKAIEEAYQRQIVAKTDAETAEIEAKGKAKSIEIVGKAEAEAKGKMASAMMDSLGDPQAVAYAMADHSNTKDISSQGKAITKV